MTKIKHAAPSVVTNEKQKLVYVHRSENKEMKGVTLVLSLKFLNRKKGYISLSGN